MDQDHLIWGTRLTSCLEKCPAAWCDFPCQQKQHSLSVMSLPHHKHTFTNSSPVYLLYLSPRQVAACISTSPLNWAAWMLNCTWHVRFLIWRLSFIVGFALYNFTLIVEECQRKKKHNLQSRRLWMSTHKHTKAWRKKTYFFCLFCVVLWGNSKTYIYPLGCREMCSSRWSCMKSRRKNVLGNAQHRNHKKQ